jgi:hypothetical protein
LTGVHGHSHWRFQAQTLVGTHPVVFPPPVFNHHSCFVQGPELLPLQALLPKPGMKAFYEAVLPRASRFDVECFDAFFLQPGLKFVMDELAAVVASDMLRCSGAP